MVLPSRLILSILFTVLGFTLIACDDDDDSTTSDANVSGGEGGTSGGGGETTPCGEMGTVCQAGQYCEDPVLQICTNGCLNDSNCASGQTCIKAAGDNEGSCQNNTTPETGPSLEQFCTKLKACEPATTDAMCSQLYNGTNESCRSCIVNANCSDDEACTDECSFG